MPPAPRQATGKDTGGGSSGGIIKNYAEFVANLRMQETQALYDIPTAEMMGECSFPTLDELLGEQKKQESIFHKTLCPIVATTQLGDDGSARSVSHCTFLRSWVWDLFENPEGSTMSNALNMYIMALICISGVIAVIETVPSLRTLDIWWDLEVFFVANFTAEFVCRMLSCPSQIKFWCTIMNYVDLVAVVPFYLDLMLSSSSGALRILRLGRSMRLVKLSRYSSGMRLVKNAMIASWDALQLFFMILVLVLIVFSSAIYYLERGTWDASKKMYFRENEMVYFDQPPEGSDPSPFQSIPQSFWWCMVTLTTVGYGDVVPITYLGQVVATMTMLVGLIMLALPLSIIGTNFIEERNKMKEQEILARNALVPQKVEEKVQPLRGSRHAIQIAEKCIQQATHTVELQHEMHLLMNKALGLVEAAKLSGSCLQDGAVGVETQLNSSSKTVLGYNIPEQQLSDAGPPVLVPPSVLQEFESICAKVIDMSQKTVDVWESGTSGAKEDAGKGEAENSTSPLPSIIASIGSSQK